jgi:hypothetical protein
VNTSDSAEFCRQIEAYLCRKNEGHLIRIVGPAFEQVCAWAERGVPLRVAFSGIERFFERYYSKGPRRRPVRIEFCEADVLDAFDEWRRAVGLTATVGRQSARAIEHVAERSETSGPEDDRAADDDASGRRHDSLPVHLERTIARLTALRDGGAGSLDTVVETTIRELDAARASAKSLRGASREAFIARLRALDAHLLESARAQYEGAAMDALGQEADVELLPFRERMPRETYDGARRACVDRLVRERSRLPTIAYD